MLEITSPRKSGPTHYEQYLVEGGRKLIVRIPLSEDYAITSMPPQIIMPQVPFLNAQLVNI